jgi:competence protein ComEA
MGRFAIDPTLGSRLGIAAAIGLAIFGALWFRGPDAAADAPVHGEVSAEPVATHELTVHVSGEVARPGLVALAPGSRVADAIAAAGGTLPAADVSGVNLAAPVRDGEHITIGSVVDAGDGRAPEDGLVHVNEAPASELEALPGVGPVLADRIASYRDQHGPFTVVEDLLDVPGIGEAKLAGLRDVVAIP